MEHFFEETVFLVHTGIAGVIYMAYKECKNIFNHLERMKTYEVGNQLMSALDATGTGMVEFAAVSGKVEALADPLLSSQGSPAVIKLLFSVGHFRNRILAASWHSSENLLYSTYAYVPFGLRNPAFFSKNVVAIVDDPTSANLTNVCMTVGSDWVEAENSSVIGFLLSTLAGKQRLGTETTEKILPVGTVVTAIGKVSKFPDGSIHISHPFGPSKGKLPFILTTSTIEEVKSHFQTQVRSYGCALIIVGSIAGFFGVRILWKWIFSFFVRKIRRDITKKRNPNGIEGLHDCQICIACLSNPREILFVPCGHICTCVDCWEKLEDYRCPICRDYIVYGYPAYIP